MVSRRISLQERRLTGIGGVIDKTFLIAKPMRNFFYQRLMRKFERRDDSPQDGGAAGVPMAIFWGGQTLRSASALPISENHSPVRATLS